MKRFLVIECDTAFSYVLVREAKQDFSATVDYHHEPAAQCVIAEPLSPQFYGKLDALLINRDKVEDAKPITPEPAEEMPHVS